MRLWALKEKSTGEIYTHLIFKTRSEARANKNSDEAIIRIEIKELKSVK